MLFHSYHFLLFFLPFALLGYYIAAYKNHYMALIWLGMMSLGYYCSWGIESLIILFTSIIINFIIGVKVNEGARTIRRLFLFSGITLNLLLLSYFKYFNFFIEAGSSAGYGIDLGLTSINNISIPMGISFYTFTQIAYIVDCYIGITKERNFFRYFLFASFFPTLLSGPLMHHKQMAGQFADAKTSRLNINIFSLGISFITIGLAKKILIADQLAPFVNFLFDGVAVGKEPKLIASWIGAISYTLQLYFDFSGYSDMAMGIALLFGYVVIDNFNSPLRAISIIDFWQRWHISLTKFIGTYLYTPITMWFMRMTSSWPVYMQTFLILTVPTVLIFLILGLWHGASWTFLIFGLVQAIYIVCNNLWRKFCSSKVSNNYGLWLNGKFMKFFYWLITFNLVVLAFVIFRADNISVAIEIYKSMFGVNGIGLSSRLVKYFNLSPELSAPLLDGYDASSFLIYFTLAFLLAVQPNKKLLFVNAIEGKILNKKLLKTIIPWTLGITLFIALINMNQLKPSNFLYFQF